MTGPRLHALLLLAAASSSLAATALADTKPLGPPKTEEVRAPALKPVAPPRTSPAGRYAPSLQTQSEGKKAPAAVPKKAAPAPKAAQAAAPAPILRIKPRNSDPGLKMEIDEAAGRVVIRGVAKGPIVKRLPPYPDYVVSRGLSFELDRHRMPDFSNEPNYTATNKWYSSHRAETSTNKGETAIVVAGRLASSLQKGGEYDVKVAEADDGSAVLELSPR